MNRYRELPEKLLENLVPSLMIGCAVWAAVTAIGFNISMLLIYCIAFVAALSAMLAGKDALFTIAAIAIPVGGALAVLLFGHQEINAFFSAVRSAGNFETGIATAYNGAGNMLAVMAALIFGSLITLLYRTQSGKPFAILIPVATVLIALTLSREITLWEILPGMAAGVAAFASQGGTRAGSRPAILITCVCIALAAVILAPAAGTTWEPLKQLAEKIRTTADEYVRFTEERVAYSINEKGYDHGGMVSDNVVTMLGGAADPTDDSVMSVQTDRDILLRGTIKQNYTGYSWIDDRAKARYLYYDFTHASTRNKIFDSETVKDNDAFEDVKVSVRMLETATSTLFVTAHMTEFNMDLSDAVYYNSTGEVFLTRDVQKGDAYEMTARVPSSDASLIEAAKKAEDSRDSGYEEAQNEYMSLPSGIDSQVYTLAASVTDGSESAVEKAIAIREYLANHYSYTLEAGYPDANEDFVSWFLLKEKKGYCSYFASAMAVMCRMVGLPARYVEGYYVRASAGETVVTGHNAHAWVEVYLNGIGWTAFDPTAAAYGAQFGMPQEQTNISPNENSGTGGEGDSLATPFEDSQGDLESAPQDQDGSGNSGNEDGGNDPSDGNDSQDGDDPSDGDDPQNGDDSENGDADSEGDGSEDNSGDSQDNDPSEQPDEEPEPETKNTSRHSHVWIWIAAALLIIAALIVFAVIWLRRRLEVTDPLRMCKKSRNARAAAMILYRAILTLLVQLGYAPMNGEMPEDFAVRVTQNIPNEAYERFVAATARSSYSGGSLKRSELEDGRDAYLAFLAGMKRTERLRYNFYRVMHGIGDTQSIP